MNKKKLTLRKEKVASLSNYQMDNINGGKSGEPESTVHNFLCGLCTGKKSRYVENTVCKGRDEEPIR